MTLEIDEIDCSFAGVTWTFYCGDIASNIMRKDLPFQLPRYHPNSRFKLMCMYKYSGDKITKQRRHYTIQLFLQAACSRQQDKPVSVLLGVIRGDKIPLKSSHGPDANSITWKTEIISINADNCIPLQPTTCNRSTSVQQALVVTCKFWLKFNDSSLGELTILTHLTDMFLNQSDCDAHFSFEDGQSIGAHINILKNSSPVFAAICSSTRWKSRKRVESARCSCRYFLAIIPLHLLRPDKDAVDRRDCPSTLRGSRQIRHQRLA